MAKKIKYSEPAAYFPKEIRNKFKSDKTSKAKKGTTKSTKKK